MYKKSGFTLVEVLTSAFIISIVVLTSVKFYKAICAASKNAEYQSSTDVNLRIAQEFMVEKIRKCNTIIINGGNYSIDGKSLYVQKDILRYGSASQQISPDVINISIEKLDGDVYRVSTIGAFNKITTLVKRGDDFEK